MALKKLDEENFQATVYKVMSGLPIKPAIETAAGNFSNSEDYGLTSYVKAAEWMYMLEQSVGREKVDAAFQLYFSLWKFKHPQPADMKAAFEQSINGTLNQFFTLLNKEGPLVK